jgi:hypothetical protein
MPVSLILLGIIALSLHILFGYLLPPDPSPNAFVHKFFITIIVIVLVLVLWYVAPGIPSVHFGRGV